LTTCFDTRSQYKANQRMSPSLNYRTLCRVTRRRTWFQPFAILIPSSHKLLQTFWQGTLSTYINGNVWYSRYMRKPRSVNQSIQFVYGRVARSSIHLYNCLHLGYTIWRGESIQWPGISHVFNLTIDTVFKIWYSVTTQWMNKAIRSNTLWFILTNYGPKERQNDLWLFFYSTRVFRNVHIQR